MRTGNKPAPPRCLLGNIQPLPMDVEAIKAEAWNTHGILVVDIADGRLGWDDVQFIKNLGDRIYGKK